MKQICCLYIGLISILLLIMSALILAGCSGMSPQTRELLVSPQQELVNYALSSNGATAESPDNNPDHPPSEVIDGNVSSLDWDNGGGWEGNLNHLRSDELLKRSYIQVNFPAKIQVKKINVYTIDSPKYPASKYGLKTYTIEYWHGAGWRKIDFTDGDGDKRFTAKDNRAGKNEYDVKGTLITEKIRLVPFSSNDTEKQYDLTAFGGKPIYNISGSSKVIEIEAWGFPSSAETVETKELNNLTPIGKALPSQDEQAIQKILSDYEQGYDNENIEQVMSGFSDRFSTLDGKDKTDIEQKAKKFFEDYNNINITLRDPKIDVSPSEETAIVEANYTLECFAKSDGNIYKRTGALVFNFQKEGDSDWKITSAK